MERNKKTADRSCGRSDRRTVRDFLFGLCGVCRRFASSREAARTFLEPAAWGKVVLVRPIYGRFP